MTNLASYKIDGIEQFKYDGDLFPQDWLQRVVNNPRCIDFDKNIGGEEASEVDFEHDDAKTICNKAYDMVLNDEELGPELNKQPQKREELIDTLLETLNGLNKESEQALQQRLEAFHKHEWVNYEVAEDQGVTQHKIDGEVVLEYTSPAAQASGVTALSQKTKALLAVLLDLAFFIIDAVFFVLALINVYISRPERAAKDLGKTVLKAMEDGHGRLQAVWQRLLNGVEIDWRASVKQLRANMKDLGKIKGARKWWNETKKVSFIKSFLRTTKPIFWGASGLGLIKAIVHHLGAWQIAKIVFNVAAAIAIFLASAGTSMIAAVVVAFGWLVIVTIDACELVEGFLAYQGVSG